MVRYCEPVSCGMAFEMNPVYQEEHDEKSDHSLGNVFPCYYRNRKGEEDPGLDVFRNRPKRIFVRCKNLRSVVMASFCLRRDAMWFRIFPTLFLFIIPLFLLLLSHGLSRRYYFMVFYKDRCVFSLSTVVYHYICHILPSEKIMSCVRHYF